MDNNFIDNEEQLKGQWEPIDAKVITPGTPSGAPAPQPHDVPPLFSGSLSPYIQHDSSFVGTQVGKSSIPSNSLMPFGPQNNPQINSAAQSIVTENSSGTVTKVPFSNITTGDNTGALMRVAGLSVLTYYQTGIVNANEIGGINVAGNTPAHAGQVLVSNTGNTSATWQDGLLYLKVTDFGAKGSGKIAFGDMTITSGTPNLESDQGPWVAGDVGKIIMVAGAGPNGTDLWTTILAFIDTQHITLSNNASTTLPQVANRFNAAIWGATDDTAAINTTVALAGQFGLAVYFPPGVYIYSAAITQPAAQPTAIIGDGNDGSFVVAQNPGIAPYSGFLRWSADTFPVGLVDMNIIGGSYDSTVGPTALQAEVQLYTLVAEIRDNTVYNTKFQWGFDIQNSFSTISGQFSVAQDRYMLDTTTVTGCQAAGFLAWGSLGEEGGTFISCLTDGDWPITYNYDVDTSSGRKVPVTWLNCVCGSGASSVVVPRGFHVIDGCRVINGFGDNSQILAVVGNDGAIDGLTSNPLFGNTRVASVVVSNGEIPYTYGIVAPYFVGDLIIDTNGNYQECTTPGNTAGGTPVWPIIIGNTVTDGGVVWTMIANPGYTPVVRAAVQNVNDFGSLAPFSLYDIGIRTLLIGNTFLYGILSADPAALQPTGWKTVTGDYTTALDDNTVYVNSASPHTIMLTTTNLLPGHVYTVKSINTGIVTVLGQSGNIDGNSSVLIPLKNIALAFQWDGTNFWIQ